MFQIYIIKKTTKSTTQNQQQNAPKQELLIKMFLKNLMLKKLKYVSNYK